MDSGSGERALASLQGTFSPRAGDALLVIDVQHDFCAGGALEVPDGDAVVAPINALMTRFGTVVLTQDWHPVGHRSFASEHAGKAPFDTVTLPYGEQTLWPDHCIQGTPGAQLHKDLHHDAAQLIIRKGFRREIDSYSAFVENDRRTPTGLAGYLRERGIERVFIAGLAYDFCVRYSAEDAHAAGFEAVIIEAACRGIDMAGSIEASRLALQGAGVTLLG